MGYDAQGVRQKIDMPSEGEHKNDCPFGVPDDAATYDLWDEEEYGMDLKCLRCGIIGDPFCSCIDLNGSIPTTKVIGLAVETLLKYGQVHVVNGVPPLLRGSEETE